MSEVLETIEKQKRMVEGANQVRMNLHTFLRLKQEMHESGAENIFDREINTFNSLRIVMDDSVGNDIRVEKQATIKELKFVALLENGKTFEMFLPVIDGRMDVLPRRECEYHLKHLYWKLNDMIARRGNG